MDHRTIDLGPPAGVPERRKRGRPRGRRVDVVRSIKLPSDVYDALCRLSLRDGISIHALIIMAARRISGSHKNPNPTPLP